MVVPSASLCPLPVLYQPWIIHKNVGLFEYAIFGHGKLDVVVVGNSILAPGNFRN